ncbi:UxaA family hydrolase [Streptomyces sp. NPDC056121]|uniref:UxaA family hydrolase n=1 Tax=unclassified Streptomyces TaxID=2593676 RepID=UPI0035D6E5FE
MTRLCLHPDTGAVVLVTLGCESFDRVSLANHIRESGRPVRALVIQETGVPAPPSRRAARPSGAPLDVLKDMLRARSAWSDLTVGTICGGSDGTSDSPPTLPSVAPSTASPRVVPGACSRRPAS